MTSLPNNLLSSIATHYGVSEEDLFDASQKEHNILEARYAAIYLSYLYYRSSYAVSMFFKVNRHTVLKIVNALVDSGRAEGIRKRFGAFLGHHEKQKTNEQAYQVR